MGAVATAQETFTPVFHPSLQVSRASGPIVIDGHLDEAAWSTAARADHFSERNPGNNTKPDVPTIAYITYDEDRLYVGFICKDDGKSVRATMAQRDQWSANDAVGLFLDTYGNGAWAYQLWVNPYGIQKDWLWTPGQNDGPNLGFDIVWQAAAERTDSGYSVEMAIPFASLRFPDQSEQKWRVDLWRQRPRSVVKQDSWAANDRSEQCFPCQFGTVTGIRDVHAGRGLEVLPSMVAHQTGQVIDPSDPHSNFHNENTQAELSLGAKYSLSSDITVEGTVNPDYSQIEADAAQIDVNSTISLFYPERRPFFQEGSDIFQTPFNSFYSRTINNPQFAGKLTSRKGNNRLGIVAAYDTESPYMIPLDASNFTLNLGKSYAAVARGSHQLGRNSQLGFFLSDRRFEHHGSGSVVSLDGRIRLSRSYTTSLNYIYTYTAEPKFGPTFGGHTFDAGKRTIALDGESFGGDALIWGFNRNSSHWNVYLGYNQISPTYRTEIGFDPVANHRTFDAYTGYSILPKSGPIVSITPQTNYSRRWDFLTGVSRYQYQSYEVYTQTSIAQTGIDFAYHSDYERWQGQYFGNITWFGCNIDSRFSNKIGAGGYLQVGRALARYQMARGRRMYYGLYASLKPIDRLTIEPQLDYARLTSLENGERYFAGYITRTRMQFQWSKALSIRLIVQYDDFGKTWNVDPLLTYRISPFSLFYLGSAVDYSQVGGDGYDPPEPLKWRNVNRQIFMKLQYLFQT
jgi:hypothetical protein